MMCREPSYVRNDARFGGRRVATMTAILDRLFHWPMSGDRINAEANRLLHENGGRALLRALECAIEAQRKHDQRQARYWHAVHGEVCRRIRREAILASILRDRRAGLTTSQNLAERDETSPYWGLALLLAMAVSVSIWGALIWGVMRMIR
jgi:hypothetical protein